MKRQITISGERIDEAALLAGRQMSDGMGAVVYFLQASNFITGQVLAVDGGLSQR